MQAGARCIEVRRIKREQALRGEGQRRKHDQLRADACTPSHGSRHAASQFQTDQHRQQGRQHEAEQIERLRMRHTDCTQQRDRMPSLRITAERGAEADNGERERQRRQRAEMRRETNV